MEKYIKHKFTTKRIGGYLHKIVPLVDSTGKVVHHVITPLMIELRNPAPDFYFLPFQDIPYFGRIILKHNKNLFYPYLNKFQTMHMDS